MTSATIIPASVMEAKRAERERQRREREAFRGSILTIDEEDPPRAPASPARELETQR